MPVGWYSLPENAFPRTSIQICPLGSYCISGERYLCPGGTFGNTTQLLSLECSGRCLAGYYCNEGSISSTEYNCGGSSVYCPEGSSKPLNVEQGYYSLPINSSELNRESQKPCEAGYYCRNGKRYDCGGVHLYCKEMSTDPTLVKDGFYSGPTIIEEENRYEELECEIGHYCRNGKMYECKEGYYGDKKGNDDETCNGKCEKGYYCPPGSKHNKQYECGGTEFYCPDGSARPIIVLKGYYSTPLNQSELNRWNQTICEKGYYCKEGKRYECGDKDVYCLEGSDNPIKVHNGYYTYPDINNNKTRYEERLCPSGYYCSNGVKYECGIHHYCPEGSSSPKDIPEGYLSGPSSVDESIRYELLNCTAGFYCSGGVMRDCGEGFYCPPGSAYPNLIPFGYFAQTNISDYLHISNIILCPIGSYCRNGMRSLCPAGHYGDVEGLSSFNCSGLCYSGYYCPEGSISPRSIDCGGIDFYCPIGSSFPIPVDDGYFSGPLNVDVNNRMFQTICPSGYYCLHGERLLCPAGSFGNVTGLHSFNCSGLCDEGYYCPAGSIQPNAFDCGVEEYYCPLGSSSPLLVPPGCYSSPLDVDRLNRFEIEVCPPGYYCNRGILVECPPGTFGNTTSLSEPTCSGICPKGYYCPLATTDFESHPCPPGTFGNSTALESPSCSGLCKPGFYCPSGSSVDNPYSCGSPNVYCPVGSSNPIPVPSGYCSGPILASPSNRFEIFLPDSLHICINGTYKFSFLSNTCRLYDRAHFLTSSNELFCASSVEDIHINLLVDQSPILHSIYSSSISSSILLSSPFIHYTEHNGGLSFTLSKQALTEVSHPIYFSIHSYFSLRIHLYSISLLRIYTPLLAVKSEYGINLSTNLLSLLILPSFFLSFLQTEQF